MFSILQRGGGTRYLPYQFTLFYNTDTFRTIRQKEWLTERSYEYSIHGVKGMNWLPVIIDEES